MLRPCDNGSVGASMCFHFRVIASSSMAHIAKYGTFGKSSLYEVEGRGCCPVMTRVHKSSVPE